MKKISAFTICLLRRKRRIIPLLILCGGAFAQNTFETGAALNGCLANYKQGYYLGFFA